MNTKKTEDSPPQLIGWREWLEIPELGIEHIKAKVDTGARTSALHTFGLRVYETDNDEQRVKFKVHPLQYDNEKFISCDFPVHSTRSVRDSGGHQEIRPFIKVPVTIAGFTWDVEMSLTKRDNMKFRMLLGRTALAGNFLVDPEKSYLISKRFMR